MGVESEGRHRAVAPWRIDKELKGAPNCNGLTFWHYEDDGGVKPIDAARQLYLLTVEHGGAGACPNRPTQF